MKNLIILGCLVFAGFWIWLGYMVCEISQNVAMISDRVERMDNTMDKWELSH